MTNPPVINPQNYVQVLMQLVNEDLGILDNGNLHFEPSDLVWVQQGNLVAPIRSVDLAMSGGSSTTSSVYLFAEDVPSISTNWKWILSGTLQGYTIPSRKLNILLSNGVNQNFADLLQSSVLV